MTLSVLVVAGAGGRPAGARLLADPRVRLVDSPRHADVLLVVGAVPAELGGPLRAVADQLAEPRTVRWWTGAAEALPGVEHAEPILDADPVPALAEAAARRSGPGLLGADEPPNPWRGVGPHGQGGEGMMGGTPYGRPMAMTGPDLRDGLALDRLALTVGPLLSPLPTGLVLDVALQGDVLVSVDVGESAFASDPRTWRGAAPPTPAGAGPHLADPHLADPDLAELDLAGHGGPLRIADLEVARARSHLEAVARTLRLAGLDALARRTARLALDVRTGQGDRVRRLRRWLGAGTSLRWLLRGVGHIDADVPGAGLVARAAGAEVDARLDDPAYSDLGFRPVTHRRGDADARLQQRLAESAQALDLAAAAGERATEPERAEGAVGPGAAGDADVRLVAALDRILLGLEWGDAVTTVDSLDLDLARSARRRRPVAA